MPNFAADDTDPNFTTGISGTSVHPNSLVSNSQPTLSNAPVSISNPMVSSGSASNGLVASAISSSGGFISGSGTTNTLAGSGSSGHDYSPLSSSQQDALTSKASEIGANPSDLFSIMNKETGGTFDPKTVAPGNEVGIIGFSKANQEKYGVKPDQSFEEQLDAAAKYLKDNGWKPGMNLAHMASIIYSGGLKKGTDEPRYNYRNKYGTTVKDYVKDVERSWYPKSTGDELKTTMVTLPAIRPATPAFASTNDLIKGFQDATAAKTAALTGLTSPRLMTAVQPLTQGVDKSAAVLESPGAATPLVPNYVETPHVPDVAKLSPGIADVVRLGGNLTPDNIVPLKYGDVSDEAKLFQEVLKTRGYYRGEIDGDFGKNTKTAVRAFQRDSGLPDTGIIDTNTALRLRELDRLTKQGPGLTPPERPTAPSSTFPARPGVPGMAPTIDRSAPVATGNPVEDALRAVVEGEKIATGGLPVVEIAPHNGGIPSAEVDAGPEDEMAVGYPDIGQPLPNTLYETELQNLREKYGLKSEDNVGPGEENVPLTAQEEEFIDTFKRGLLTRRYEGGVSPAAQPSASALQLAKQGIGKVPTTEVVQPAPEYSAPPGSIPAGDRVGPAPKGPDKLDRKQEFDKMYEALPPGAIYVSPDGKTRRKGGKTSQAEGGTRVASADRLSDDDLARATEWEGLLTKYLQDGIIDPEQYQQMIGPNIPTREEMRQVRGKSVPQDPKSKLQMFNRLPQRNLTPGKPRNVSYV